jgi:hypothetical protein
MIFVEYESEVEFCAKCGHPDFGHKACKWQCDITLKEGTEPCDCDSFMPETEPI